MYKKPNQNPNQSKFNGPICNPGCNNNPEPPYPDMELARAYIPIQKLNQLSTPAQALEAGTLFPELYRPYP